MFAQSLQQVIEPFLSGEVSQEHEMQQPVVFFFAHLLRGQYDVVDDVDVGTAEVVIKIFPGFTQHDERIAFEQGAPDKLRAGVDEVDEVSAVHVAENLHVEKPTNGNIKAFAVKRFPAGAVKMHDFDLLPQE